jgi:hypothetical protein
VKEMAGNEKPESVEEPKKNKKTRGGRLPLDAILLVVVPFVAFLFLFLYVMGFIPPRPAEINYLGTRPPGPEATSEIAAESQVDAGETPTVPEPQPGLEEEVDVAGGPDQETEAGEDIAPAGEVGDAGEIEAAGATPETRIPEPPDAPESEDVEENESGRQARLKQLAKVYEQMNSASVAAIVANMSDQEAEAILAMMKPRNAAKVLAELEPERAAVLSLLLAN